MRPRNEKLEEELKSRLCELLASFASHFTQMTPNVKYRSPCYEDEWSRLELSVLVFSRDG